jgi:hypothetical protein
MCVCCLSCGSSSDNPPNPPQTNKQHDTTQKQHNSRKNELPGIAQWMVEQRHKRIYAEDVLRLNAEAVAPGSTSDGGNGVPLMCLAL